MIVCPDHQDDQLTALTFTLSWPYKEYWCGFCGRQFKMFDDYDRKESSNLNLELMGLWYKKRFKRYLRAVAMLEGDARLSFHGRMLSARDLSADTVAKMNATMNEGWKPGVRYQPLEVLK
jgi:hypothetical protein